MTWQDSENLRFRDGSSRDNLFLSQAFLGLMEDSGSCTAATGWEPQHVTHSSGAQLPLYRKHHPWGEYVFDWAWEDVYARTGRQYYPKLLTAIPYTPSVGPRQTRASAAAWQDWQNELPERCARTDTSGWHLLFPDEAALQYFSEPDFILRQGCQFHWHNADYRDFDDFLARMTSRRRKTIRKERRRVDAQGIELRRIPAGDMTPDWLEAFYAFYHTTYLQRGRSGYLTRTFFTQLVETLPDQVVFVLAFRAGDPIAGALFLHDNHCLYGRYWGALEEIDCLHFETCYYQGIELAIELGLARFDPGTQGEHKIPRGFEPVPTWSVHWLAQRELHELIRRHMAPEREQVAAYMAQARTLLPFRNES